jgi:hypothetical protein
MFEQAHSTYLTNEGQGLQQAGQIAEAMIRHVACLRFQLRSKPLFEVKGHQIPFVYAVLVGAVGIETASLKNKS